MVASLSLVLQCPSGFPSQIVVKTSLRRCAGWPSETGKACRTTTTRTSTIDMIVNGHCNALPHHIDQARTAKTKRSNNCYQSKDGLVRSYFCKCCNCLIATGPTQVIVYLCSRHPVVPHDCMLIGSRQPSCYFQQHICTLVCPDSH